MASDDVQILDATEQLVAISTDVILTMNGSDITGNSPQTEVQRQKVGYGSDSVHQDVDSTHPLPVAVVSETTLAGATPFKLISAASTNATSVKNTVGKVYTIMASNTNAAARYLKLYDKASAPTVGTDVPKWTILLPGNAAGAGVALSVPMPVKFTVGIALALTTGVADADTGAVAANEIVVNLAYA